MSKRLILPLLLTAVACCVAAPAAAQVGIKPNHLAIVYSPYTWNVTASSATTTSPGAYFKTVYTGSTCFLNFDVTQQALPTSQIYVRVDGYEGQTPWTPYKLASVISCKPGSDHIGDPYHLVEVTFKAATSNSDRWNPPIASAVKFTGLTLGERATATAPVKMPRNLLFYGDSITEGSYVGNGSADYHKTTSIDDALTGYVSGVCRAMAAECGIVGFGGAALTKRSQDDVPPLSESLDSIYSGVKRSFTPAPDMIVIAYGTNDSEASEPAVTLAMTAVLKRLLAATPSRTKIVVMQPFDGTKTAAIQLGVRAAGSRRVTYVSTSGIMNPAYGAYGHDEHPSATNSAAFVAPAVVRLLEPILAPDIRSPSPPGLRTANEKH